MKTAKIKNLEKFINLHPKGFFLEVEIRYAIKILEKITYF